MADKSRPVWMSKETSKKIMQLKLDLELRTAEDVVKFLLDKWN